MNDLLDHQPGQAGEESSLTTELPQPTAEGGTATAKPHEVLVVDDSHTLRLMLSMYVAQLGHRVTTANNGREALELLRRQPFDLVLMDIEMPEMDGYAALDAIKSDEALRDIPVVMISGVDELASIVRCIE